MKKIILATILCFLLIPSVAVIAADPPAPAPTQSQTDNKYEEKDLILNVPIGEVTKGQVSGDLLGNYFKAWYDLLLGSVGIIATVVIMWGGFKWLSSRGDTKQISDAQDVIFSAITGLVLTFGSYLIISLINPKLTQINMPEIGDIEVRSKYDAANVGYSGKDSHGNTPDGSGSYPVGTDRRSALAEKDVRDQLRENGVGVNKNPCTEGVAYQNTPDGCTSVAGLQQQTIDEAVKLKKDCNCDVTVTGGTELGHHTGNRGYQLDVGKNNNLDAHIRNTGRRVSPLFGNYPSYAMPSGYTYVDEGDHWHIEPSNR